MDAVAVTGVVEGVCADAQRRRGWKWNDEGTAAHGLEVARVMVRSCRHRLCAFPGRSRHVTSDWTPCHRPHPHTLLGHLLSISALRIASSGWAFATPDHHALLSLLSRVNAPKPAFVRPGIQSGNQTHTRPIYHCKGGINGNACHYNPLIYPTWNWHNMNASWKVSKSHQKCADALLLDQFGVHGTFAHDKPIVPSYTTPIFDQQFDPHSIFVRILILSRTALLMWYVPKR